VATEGSSPCTQQITSCPYPEPDESVPRPPYSFSKIHLISSLHLCPGLTTEFFPFRFHHHVIYTSFFFLFLCYMLRPAHPPWFDHSNYIRREGSSRDKWVPVTTAWRVFRLRMGERPPVWRVAANIY